MYEHLIYVEDLNNHNVRFLQLVQAQSWDVAFMSPLGTNLALPQIREFYYTLEKVNKGYYTAKVEIQEFHLHSGLVTQVLGVPYDGNKIYFNNVLEDSSTNL